MFSDVGFYDRIVVQEIIKEIAQTQQVTPNAPREYKGRNFVALFEKRHYETLFLN